MPIPNRWTMMAIVNEIKASDFAYCADNLERMECPQSEVLNMRAKAARCEEDAEHYRKLEAEVNES